MPFDFNTYRAKCEHLSPEELDREWQSYTRQISGGATLSASAVLLSPLTQGISLVGLGYAVPRMHNARKKMQIVESNLITHGQKPVTRKRDVIIPVAISGAMDGLTFGLAGPGADLIAGEAAGKGIEYLGAHVALEVFGQVVEHHYDRAAKKRKKKLIQKMRDQGMDLECQEFQKQYAKDPFAYESASRDQNFDHEDQKYEYVPASPITPPQDQKFDHAPTPPPSEPPKDEKPRNLFTPPPTPPTPPPQHQKFEYVPPSHPAQDHKFEYVPISAPSQDPRYGYILTPPPTAPPTQDHKFEYFPMPLPPKDTSAYLPQSPQHYFVARESHPQTLFCYSCTYFPNYGGRPPIFSTQPTGMHSLHSTSSGFNRRKVSISTIGLNTSPSTTLRKLCF
ncbi:uncharacterized protein L3040_003774 [Drepanopeziza brunnea f. sp. 'multigermtubi']|uniref:uncharacterized protein n=1 Tax=Drepanopeziza brunnea f. sp. 'multigermtubi' TaxID=698441 RepID=UPI00238C81C3|nr:hypothetical protein L3040_003774 [Drepanopeziza brunnea f. sp. 'multigermtubi']